MLRHLPLIALLGVSACVAPPPGSPEAGMYDVNRPWAPNETMSTLGKKDCARPRPPATHSARSKWDRTCLRSVDF